MTENKLDHEPMKSELAAAIPQLPKKTAAAVGALAVGAFAVGALAFGALAIGRLAIGRAKIRRLEIDELVVRRLRVTESVETVDVSKTAREDAP
jgi:hypothetical protein